MSKIKRNRAKGQPENPRRRRKRFIIVGTILSLILTSGVLAQWTGIISVTQKKGEIAPASLTENPKEYVYAGGRLVATEEPTAPGCANPLTPPGNLQATATSDTSIVGLTWTASSGTVDHYEVERKSSVAAPYVTVIFNIPSTSLTVSDNGLSPDTAYLYRVRAFDSANCPSPYSNVDLATTTSFSEPIVSGVTLIKASPLTELQRAVNAVHITAGLGPFNWASPAPAPGGSILKTHIEQLRTSLNFARIELGLLPQSYTDPTLTTMTLVKAVHILDLRDGVK